MKLATPKHAVAIVRGGESRYQKLSMQSGGVWLDALADHHRVTPMDVMVAPSGEWLHDGRAVAPSALLGRVEGVLITALGHGAEDGALARTCQRFGIRHQLPDPFACLETWRKSIALQRAREQGIRVPRQLTVSGDGNSDYHALTHRVADLFGLPLIVKPHAAGQLQSVRRVTDLARLPAILSELVALHDTVVIEECLPGTSITVTVLPSFRGQAWYVTSPLEWMHTFDSDQLIDTASRLDTASLTHSQREAIYSTATNVAQTFSPTATTRIDLQLTPEGHVYFLEVNTVPILVRESPFRQSLNTVGISLPEYTEYELGRVLG